MKKIGYTTGVFDMFHVGHLNVLRRASLECDYLIVGVTTDELSSTAKGKKPIIPLQERIEIVNAISFVDEVVTQNNYDKFEAWSTIKFDLMLVGDDWQGTDKWNAIEAEFNDVGVEIVYLPYTKHTSSTKLRKILDNIYAELV